MRNRLLIVALIVFNFISATRVFGQGAVTSFKPDTFFQGQVFPDMIIYGQNLVPFPYHLDEIYFSNSVTNYFVSGMWYSAFDPQWDYASYSDSVIVRNISDFFVPFDADTGLYNIIITRENNGLFIVDTLFNALRIIPPDGTIGGYLYLDRNLNHIYDNSDTLLDVECVYMDRASNNYRIDSVGHYYFPVMNDSHVVAIRTIIDDYVLSSDSSIYHVYGSSFYGANFGLAWGFDSCSVDTLYQNDSVTIDFYSHGLFPGNAIVLVDSAFISDDWSYDSLELSFDWGSVVTLDSNHCQVSFTVPTNLIGACPVLFRPYTYCNYTLKKRLYILPSLTNNTDKKEDAASLIKVFPNPANSVLHIAGNFVPRKELNVYNVYGQCYNVKFIDEEVIDISNLPAGMYDLRIDNDLTSCRLSFIKLSTQ